jgi:cobalt-zinc-cadmium resistance protein CzcA
MLDRLVTFALRQRVFVLIATAALVAFGWRALSNLPIEAFPDVQDTQVQVVTQFPGQAPEEVERSVTLPIEREMAGVPRMTQLRSVSITGLSVVTLTFSDNTDDYFVRQQVLEKLQNVNLPPSVQPQLAPLSTAVGEIYRYMIDAPAEMPDYEVRALQDWVIRPALRIVPGIADVVSFGGSIKEYQVRLDPYALKKFGVTIDQVATALSANSANSGGGLLRRGEEALVIRGIGLFRTADDIGQAIVASRAGRTILVSDLAESVAIGRRPLSGVVGFNDRDSIVEGIVMMTKGQNATKVVKDLEASVAEVQAKLPKGVRIAPFYKRTDLIQHTVHTVVENLAVGALLVIAILIIFLRNWRAALIVACVIPLSLLAAFIMMDARGVSANLISLGAIDFGIIIDSAVVLVEALMVRLAMAQAENNPAHAGYGWRLQTLRHTVVELGHPILFAKAIIITAFLPIFTFQRVEGKIFSPVAITLTFALLGAIMLTMTLVPTLLSYTMRRENMAEAHSEWLHGLQERYRRLLARAQGRRNPVLFGSVALLALSLGLSPLLGSEFLPKLDEGNIWLTITLPPSASLERTKDVEREARAILRSYPEVGNVVTQVGRPDDGTDPKGPNNLEILADLKPRGSWRFSSKEDLVADMSRKIRVLPGVPTNFSQVIQDNVEESLSGTKGEINVKVFGPDLEILESKARQIAAILGGIRGATDVAAVPIGGQTELDISVDRARIARYGINVADVNSVIQTALAGSAVNAFFEGDRRFDVTLRIADTYRDAVDDIAHLQVSLPGGTGTVALGDIATVAVRQGASRVSRQGGGRIALIKSNLRGRDLGSFIDEAQRKVGEQVNLPPGYTLTWGGQFENQQRANQRLMVIVPLSALLIFSLLFWAFRSVKKAMLVLAMVPFTLIGGIAGLALAGLHLSISAAVGFIAVAGISVQNGVIMVEQIVEFMERGRALASAVVDGAVLRLRPILMTALMAGLGLLPAALSQGIGSETQRPFAVVIVGGIVSATLFTLLLLPLLFPSFAGESEAPPG